MTISLVPLCQFSDHYKRGWRIVPGYDLKANDYAATMMSPGHKLVDDRSNASRGAISADVTRKKRETASA